MPPHGSRNGGPPKTAPKSLSGAIMNRLSPIVAAILFFIAAALGSALPLPARAAESYENCTGFIDAVPATITTPGTWCLRHDVSTAITVGSAIRVASRYVTLDCNHFTIDGSGDAETHALGVNGGISIRNCNIRGFNTGIFLSGEGSFPSPAFLVERNTLVGNTRTGIFVRGAGSTIRGNRVIDTGGSTLTSEPGVTWPASGITAFDGVDVIDNTVDGVDSTSSVDADAYGIRTINNGDASVNRNRIRGLVAYNGATAYGIHNANSRGLIIRGNNLQGVGAMGVGLRCSSTPATARDNVISGFAIGVQRCMSVGNTVNTY
jgi:hypothetical protein